MSALPAQLARARLEFDFVARSQPLPACAALARGQVAERLVRRLLLLTDEQLGALRGAASRQLVLLLGATEALPWVDGIAYFGREPQAPSLLLPCATCPTLPLELVARSVALRWGKSGAVGPFVLADAPRTVIDSSEARPVDRAQLYAWLATRAERP